MAANTLYCGDNLLVLRKYVPDASVDLVYLDPPFNSQQTYNVMFREQGGADSPAQIKAFTDTWHWTERAYDDFLQECRHAGLLELVRGFVHILGRNQLTAYIVMMAPRLSELHRVLKPTGSLYLHCDPTASHYLKIILDSVFGPANFRNEIIWERHQGHSDAHRFGSVHDVLLYYRRSKQAPFCPVRVPYSAAQMARYRKDANGRLYRAENLTGAGTSSERTVEWRGVHPGANRHWMWSIDEMERLLEDGRILLRTDGRPRKDGYKAYLDEMSGKAIGDVWSDVPRVPNISQERLGYPTQKPVALLERILAASSNPGDVILDPFCGCGTAVVAAQVLGRQWVGIDVAHVAVSLIKYRLADTYDLQARRDYAVIGEPTTDAEARALAIDDRDDFQKWAVGLVPRAMVYQDKKGADSGIDGLLYFRDDLKDPKKCVIQVKSGHVSVAHARDFAHVTQRERATLGLFITLDPPTTAMQREAGTLGFYTTPIGDMRIERLQYRTVGQLLQGQPFHVPSYSAPVGVPQAPRAQPAPGQTRIDV